MNIPRVRGARVVEVIEVVAPEGSGKDADPVREVVRYYSFDGQLLATDDPVGHRFIDRVVDIERDEHGRFRPCPGCGSRGNVHRDWCNDLDADTLTDQKVRDIDGIGPAPGYVGPES